MASTFKFTKKPAFVVEPQPVSKNSKLSKQEQQTTFRTDRRQYKQSLQTISFQQIPSGAAPQSKSYSRNIRFADPKTQTAFTSRQYNPDERPAKRLKVNRYEYNAEPSFSVRRPLKIRVPMDAWQLIFQRCDLPFLMNARLVCRDFCEILDRQAVWRRARFNYYGDGLPDPPPGISELHYAALLVGRGCQIQPCTRRDTRKVYWPFMLRMCEKCFHQTTEAPDSDCPEGRLYSDMYHSLEYEVRQTIPVNLPGLLPAGKMKCGRWMGPRPLDDDQKNWRDRFLGDTTVVLADEYGALRTDFREKVQNDPEYFLFWARLKWGETRDRMEKIFELEEIDLSDSSKLQDLRDQKIVLFGQKASELDPPMDLEILYKFSAYHSAIDTPNAASLRSWDILKAKIDMPELRAEAEQLLQWERDAPRWNQALSLDGLHQSEVHDRVSVHRTSGRHRTPTVYVPEQQVVIDIAREQLDKLLNVVHDEDLLLMWLTEIRRTYELLEPKPEGLNGDGVKGPYTLILDDVSLVVQDVLRPRLMHNSDDRNRHRRIMGSLRCMGCTRTNPATTYEFRDLVTHIRKTHSNHVVKDAHWYRFALPPKPIRWSFEDRVAWYLLPWFKTMPALPFHRKATPGMTWDPDVETEYIQHWQEEASIPSLDLLVASQTKIPVDDVISNFCRAVRTLIHSRLGSQYVIKVALEYAIRRRDSRRLTGTPPSKLSLSQLQNLETVCARITTRLDFRFQCALCTQELAGLQGRRRSTKSMTLVKLFTHLQFKHRVERDSCTTDHIVLPSEVDLMDMMKTEDAKLEEEKGAWRKRNGEGIDPRGTALLETPSIRSCFDKLFVRRVGGEDGV